MVFRDTGYSLTTTKMMSTTQFVTVQSRICSSHPHRFQIWEPWAFHVHKSLEYIKISFIQQTRYNKGRKTCLIQHVSETKTNSQIWILVLGVLEVPWGLVDPRHALPICMTLIKTISISHIVLYIVYVCYSVVTEQTFCPLVPGSPGVPGKPGGPSGPCV